MTVPQTSTCQNNIKREHKAQKVLQAQKALETLKRERRIGILERKLEQKEVEELETLYF